MKTIWKFTLESTQLPQIINMPKGAKVLSCVTQNEKICIWAEVDSQNDSELRVFTIYGTGSAMPSEYVMSKYVFVGTCFLAEGAYVFHVYEALFGENKYKFS